MVKKFSLKEFNFEVEIGRIAKQADGAVWFRQGGTVLLATATTSKARDFLGFLPLTTDYREQFASIGKIPGGVFKREGKFTDKEVLTSRLIDRSIRPLFPARFFDQLQVLSTVYSMDKEHNSAPLALIASSLALVISKIPFFGPVGAVEACKIDDKWVLNPSFTQTVESDVRLLVAGTQDGICMIEGCLDEVAESDLLDVLFDAHEIIKKQVEWQKEIQKEVGVEKKSPEDGFDWDLWTERSSKFFTEDVLKKLYVKDKQERNEQKDAIKEAFMTKYEKEIEESKELGKVKHVFNSEQKAKLNDFVFKVGKRVDERGFDQVRDINSDVSLLPFAHGSALFTRGQTQALATTTLGGGQDEPKILDLLDEAVKTPHIMLHYNFPPFSVGEVRMMRAPGRREVGHGFLALSSIRPMMPDQEQFPYTIRIVADILESNGSSSMATVCASTLSLMDAGVPMKKMVGGIAMGLLKSSDGDHKILSDITGMEDDFGLMDFKVAGTGDGITAIQMDIKSKVGFPREIFEKAFDQAKTGRLHILSKMSECMTKPRADVSDLVPKIVSFKVDTNKIGAIIGSGGKVIREIISQTETSIDIEDDGTVKIFGHPGENMDRAISWVKVLGDQINAGDRFNGIIRRLADFGLFVELAPGRDGLLHISFIPRHEQSQLDRHYKVGDVVPVEVVAFDPVSDRIKLKFVQEENNKNNN